MLAVLIFRRSGSKPTASEFSAANKQGRTKIVVVFEDSPCRVYWQYLNGKWCFVQRWRVANGG